MDQVELSTPKRDKSEKVKTKHSADILKKKIKEKKLKKRSKKKRKKHRSSSSDSSSDSSSSSSSSEDESSKKRKKKSKKNKSKLKKKKKASKKSEKKVTEVPQQPPTIPVVPEADVGPNISLSSSKIRAPMTKAEWEKQQSTLRWIIDPETGRKRFNTTFTDCYRFILILFIQFFHSRLVNGGGEIMEEIVTKERC